MRVGGLSAASFWSSAGVHPAKVALNRTGPTPSTTNLFREDLSSTSNDSKKALGAVAIGKKVRFYRFDGKKPYEQQIVQLHQGTCLR